MPAKTVNLDALIYRDDFEAQGDVDEGNVGGNPRQTIAVSDLDNGFFENRLRKPDFQRETTHWSTVAVVDLIEAFLDGDLIPSVILWERRGEIFVIDGAHRLSALLAWIHDDYGDREASSKLFGIGITDKQRQIAEETRKRANLKIGPYKEFRGLIGQRVEDPTKNKRLSALATNSIHIQWVRASTVDAAEASFFKINQAAQPIDPVERRILQSRTAPNAIAARCIARGGKGHKYWSKFSPEIQQRIEELGSKVHAILFTPPPTEPIKSLDLPLAGQSYNALPFVFDLIRVCNDLKMPSSENDKTIEKALPSDHDGGETVKFLDNVKKRLEQVSTNDSRSLGFHPIVYYYAKTGNFMPNAFLASLVFAKKLHDESQKNNFINVRERFERYLHDNKDFVSSIITKRGSGARSLHLIADLYWEIFMGMHRNHLDADIFNHLTSQDKFAYLKQFEAPSPSAGLRPSKKGASKKSKSAAFIREAFQSSPRCPICRGLLHRNSITADHIMRRRDGGDNQSDNLQPTHPYCNSGYKG